jgi:tetratricopeptide (TPR) repeat protein
MDDGGSVLDVVRRRWSVFEQLLDGPMYKRDLVAAVDRSRSTVDRAVRELDDAGLVERVDGGYVATVAGQLAAEEYRTATDSMAAVEGAMAALEPLPHDAPVSGALLADATISTADRDTDAAALADRFVDHCSRADEPRVAIAGAADEAFVEAVRTATDGSVLLPSADDGNPDGRAATSPPPFSLLRTPSRVTVLVHTDGGRPHALIEATSDVALAWGSDRLVELDPDRSTRVSGTGEDGDAAAVGPSPASAETGTAGASTAGAATAGTARLASEGFERLDAAAFDAAATDPLTALRTGHGFADVAAGHALPREIPAEGGDADAGSRESGPPDAGSEGERERLDKTLLARLTEGRDVALVGPPGSGKSTVCRQVAHRWYEADRGSVWYRQSGQGRSFTATGELVAAAQSEPGHTLIVVEDAVRAGGAVFETMRALQSDPTVSVLVDARTEEWGDPPGEPLPPAVRAYRDESVEVVRMPPLDRRERERFVTHVAAGLDRSAAELAAAVRAVAPEDRDAVDSAPSAVLAFLHCLAMAAGAGGDAPSALQADAEATLARLRDQDEATYDLGVLVNLLNAAGLAVEPASLYTLVAPPADHDPAAIDAAVEALHGQVLFGASPLDCLLPHEEWSVAFLDALVEAEPEPAAQRRVGRLLSTVWSLADEPASREAVRDALGAEAAVLDRIADDPTGWADETADQLFALVERRPGLLPLFGESEHSALHLPAACSPKAVVRCLDRRCEARFDRGDYEVQNREAAALYDRACDLADPDRTRFRSAAYRHRAWAAIRTGSYDAGDRYAAWALALAERIDDDHWAHKALGARGVAAWLAGDLDEAERHLRAAEKRADPEGDPAGAASVQNNLGIVHYGRGDFDAALERFERSRSLRERAGVRLPLVDSLINLGVIERDRGQPEAAIERFESAVDLARDAGGRDFLAHALRALGNTLADCGRPDEATERLEEALDLARDAGNRENVAHCLRGLGVAARERGDLDDAEAHLTESRETAAAVEADRALALALRELGTLARDRGNPERALEYLDEALATFDPDTRNVETARAHRERGEALLALGNDEAAREAFATAREQYRSLGAESRVAECEGRMAAAAD